MFFFLFKLASKLIWACYLNKNNSGLDTQTKNILCVWPRACSEDFIFLKSIMRRWPGASILKISIYKLKLVEYIPDSLVYRICLSANCSCPMTETAAASLIHAFFWQENHEIHEDRLKCWWYKNLNTFLSTFITKCAPGRK